MLAMRRAVEGLRLKPVLVLVDGNRLPVLDVLAEAIVKGDARCSDLGGVHPGQGAPRPLVRQNSTSNTRTTGLRPQGLWHGAHLAALREHGACPQHRSQFAPVAQRCWPARLTTKGTDASHAHHLARQRAAQGFAQVWRRTTAAYRKQGRVWLEGDHLCRAALARGWRPPGPVFESGLVSGPGVECAGQRPKT
jgi:hypothetical protein